MPSVLPRSESCRRRSASCPAFSDATCCGIWRIAASTSAPGQLGGGVGRRARVQVGRHDDAEPGAGVDVDVRVDAALADQPEAAAAARAARRGSRCARGSARAPRCRCRRSASSSMSWTWSFQTVTSWPASFAKQSQRAQRVEVVVEDRDLHRRHLPLALPDPACRHRAPGRRPVRREAYLNHDWQVEVRRGV